MDRGLVVRAREGDHDAFSALAAASIAQLDAVARLILRDNAAADDAVQDALIEAWRGIRGLRDPDQFEAWLRRLLVRACYDRSRRERRRRVVEIQFLSNAEPAVPDAQGSLAVHDQLDRGLRRLPIDQRAALVLTYYLELPLAESAQILGVPVGTLKSRVHRSLDALRAIVDADERDPAAARELMA